MTSTLTLIVPVFAKHSHVKEMLESILNLTQKPDFLILVDDRHGEKTSEELNYFVNNKYSYPVRLIKNEKNLGISNSMRVALTFVSTKYIGFLDSDDILLPDAIARFKLKNLNLSAYSSNYSTFKGQFSEDILKPMPREKKFYLMYLNLSDWNKALLFENAITHFRVVETSIAKQFDWNSIQDGIQDLLLNYSLSINDRVYLDSHTSYFHREHKNQTTHLFNNSAIAHQLLNIGRLEWRKKLGFYSNKKIEFPVQFISSKFYEKLNQIDETIFFLVDENGNVDLVQFDETIEILNTYTFVGCYLSPHLDDYYIRRGLLNLYPKSNIPIVLFVDTNSKVQLNYVLYFSGLFDQIIDNNKEDLVKIRNFIPPNINIF